MKNKFSKIIFFGITFIFLFLLNSSVNASVIESKNIVNVTSIKNNFANKFTIADSYNTCESLLGDPNNCDKKCPAYWFQWVLNVMKYAAIVALLVLVISDFLNALVQNDKDALKKAGNKAIRRFIYCVLLFFVPNLVELIMQLFGVYGNCLG